MAVELNNLMDQVRHMKIERIAGEEGMTNLVRWTHMVDSPEISEFLEGGEVAFTTGIGVNEHVSLYELVKSVHKNGAAAIVINIGPYVKEITEDIIKYGNDNAFPIFKVPWEIHMSEIMRIFCFAITKSEQTNAEIESAFRSAIYCPRQEELYVGALMQKSFLPEWNYCTAVVTVQNSGGYIDDQRLKIIKQRLSSHIIHNHKNTAVISMDKNIVVIIGKCDDKKVREVIDEINEHISRTIYAGEKRYIGVGKVTKSIRCIYKSYNQALKLTKILIREKGDGKALFYSDMGIYKLLMSIEDKEIIEDYFNDTINPLMEYDRLNQTDLTDVLRCYINHSGSVKDTALELYVHRNTINYKIKKIEEILDADLSSLDVRMKLNIGFMLKNLRNL